MSYRLIYGHQESFIDRIINSSTSYFISLFHGPAVDKFLMLQLCDKKKKYYINTWIFHPQELGQL